jgi:hypothetical protein
VFDLDLTDKDDFKIAPELIYNLTKKAVEKKELNALWRRVSALSRQEIAKDIYSEEVVRLLRGCLRRDTGIYFQLDDIADVVYSVITKPTELGRPRLKKLR